MILFLFGIYVFFAIRRILHGNYTSYGLGIGGGDSGGIQTQVVTDPYKTAVSSPLSSYLASTVGTGLPAYTGTLTADLSTQAKTNLSNFESINPEQWFKTNITDPTMANYQNNLRWLTDENYAGGLSGSGRQYGQEQEVGSLSSALATEAGTVIPEIQGMQSSEANQYAALLNQNYQTQYKAWLQTLPEYNPALQDAISFLGADSGYEILSGMASPDTSTASLLGAGIQGGSSIASAAMIASALAA